MKKLLIISSLILSFAITALAPASSAFATSNSTTTPTSPTGGTQSSSQNGTQTGGDVTTGTDGSTTSGATTGGGAKAQILQGINDAGGADNSVDVKGLIKNGIGIFMWVIGILAIVFIIYAAFLYVTSAGNADNVKRAKNTILYAVVGLIVAIVSGAIVTFVVENVK